MSLNHRGTQRSAEEKYKAYAEYKDSGVEWLGEIPKSWSSLELKRYSHVQGGYAFNSDSFTDFGEAVIRIGDIKQDGSISLDSCKYVSIPSINEYKQYQIKKGDLLMAMTGATIGKAGRYQSNDKAFLNQRVGAFKCNKEKLNFRFYWYILNSYGYQEYIKLTAFGGAQPNISDTGMVGYKAAIPSIEEQKQIAAFLDRETAKIDTLIDKQKKLIALLKEKRQATISHAVTKGLNPNAPMKDSGIPWLGKIPAHWVERPLKFMAQIKNGRDYKHIEVNEGEGYPVIGSGGEFTRASDFLFSGSSVLLGRKGSRFILKVHFGLLIQCTIQTSQRTHCQSICTTAH